MIRQNTRFEIGQVSEDSFDGHILRKDDREGLKSVSFQGRFDEQPVRGADPHMATSHIVHKGFKFNVVDLAPDILQDANGKATERLTRQVTPICCEAWSFS